MVKSPDSADEEPAMRPLTRVRRTRQLLALACAAGPVLAIGAAASPAFAATQPVPRAAVVLPAALEGMAPYVPADTCDPVAKPGVVKFAALLQRTYAGTGSSGIIRDCAGEANVSEHTEGRAFDWTVNINNPAQVAQVHALTSWLLAPDAHGNLAANARRLGVMYIIWNKQILGLYNLAAGWRPYACSGVTACHQDHVHFSLTWAGARGVTSFWTGKVAADDYGPCVGEGQMFAFPTSLPNPAPCRTAGPLPVTSPVIAGLRVSPASVLAQGSTGPAVVAVQQALGGTVADGQFGSGTRGMVLLYERRRHLPATGTVTYAVRADLVSYVSGGQARLVPVAVPVPAPAPAPKPPIAAPRPPVVVAKPVPASPLAPYFKVVLRQGSRGAAVVAMQRALHVGADGDFGPLTRAALVRFQSAHRLAATGVTSTPTWAALAGVPAPASHVTRPAPVVLRSTVLLRQGSTGAAVVALQRALHIAADGSFGSQTRAAVIAFQRAHHLTADGVVGTATRAALHL